MYKFHELANAFPLIEGSEFEELVASIRDNGQREAITYFEGKILDGRNRYRACLEADVKPFGGDFEGDFNEARKFVIDLNMRRRHLDESQRALASAKLANLRLGDNQHSEGLSIDRASKMLNVGVASAYRARTVLDKGVPELVHAVEQGEIAVSAAAEIAKLPQDEQRERVSQPGGYASLTGNDHWYTPSEHIERARRVLGRIYLDPASSAIAQRRVRADNFFTEADDGLAQEWHGRVWLNPPYSKGLIGRFTDKLVSEYISGNVTEAILLVNDSTDTKWFHKAADGCAVVCFTKGRVSFLTPSGEQVGSPAMGNAFFYFGAEPEKFASEFGEIGLVWTPYRSAAAELSLARAAA
jgi:phage N-6-adenine-methyltransferase